MGILLWLYKCWQALKRHEKNELNFINGILLCPDRMWTDE